MSGELGDGTGASSRNFVQAETEEGILEHTLMIGRSSGKDTSLNTAVINESGRVYTAGNNSYGQIGDSTKDNTNYFKVMEYVKIDYPEKIKMHVGETLNLTPDDLKFNHIFFNVYREDSIKDTLINNAKILDEGIASYSSRSN